MTAITKLPDLAAFSSAPIYVTNAGAGYTAACSAFLDPHVFPYIWVALWAMCAITLDLSCFATANVFAVRHEFHVIAINAWAKSTFMIRFQPFWNWAALQNPRCLRIANLFLANLKASVSVFIQCASPKPASVFKFLDVTHEAFDIGFECKLIVSHLRRAFRCFGKGCGGVLSTAAARIYSTPILEAF